MTSAFIGPISFFTSPWNVATSVVMRHVGAAVGRGPEVHETPLAQVDRVVPLVREADADRPLEPVELLRHRGSGIRLPVEPVDERSKHIFDSHGS